MLSKVVCDNVVYCETAQKYLLQELAGSKKRKARGTDSMEVINEPTVSNNNDDNSLGTSCLGTLDEDKIKEIQDELDRAKEEHDNYSTKSRCEIQ